MTTWVSALPQGPWQQDWPSISLLPQSALPLWGQVPHQESKELQQAHHNIKENLRITSHWTELPTGKLEPSTTTQPPHPSTQTVQHPTKSGYKIQETSQLYLWGTSMHIPFQYLNQIAHSSTTTSTFAIIFLSMHDHHSWLQVHYFFNIYFKYNVMLEWSWVIKS